VQLSYTQIRSPVTGRVGIRNVDPGNLVRTSDTQGLFSVTQIDPIAVEFSLPQQMLPTLQNCSKPPRPRKWRPTWMPTASAACWARATWR
jgi:hypothetical protein